jgi:acetyltransferase-like isoleucine patch superfamily enzyme
MIGPYVSLSAGMAPGQQMVSDPVVSIGDRTLIGRGSHIVGHFCIEIGDDIQTGPYVYITDQNHVYNDPDVPDPDVPIGAQWPVESSVHIGSGSWLGTGVVVLPGSRIGRNVAVGAGSVVTGELPDHCVAVGSPAKVVKRYSPDDGWRATDLAAHDAMVASGPSPASGAASGAVQKLAGSNGLTAPKKKKSTTSETAPPTP